MVCQDICENNPEKNRLDDCDKTDLSFQHNAKTDSTYFNSQVLISRNSINRAFQGNLFTIISDDRSGCRSDEGRFHWRGAMGGGNGL